MFQVLLYGDGHADRPGSPQRPHTPSRPPLSGRTPLRSKLHITVVKLSFLERTCVWSGASSVFQVQTLDGSNILPPPTPSPGRRKTPANGVKTTGENGVNGQEHPPPPPPPQHHHEMNELPSSATPPTENGPARVWPCVLARLDLTWLGTIVCCCTYGVLAPGLKAICVPDMACEKAFTFLRISLFDWNSRGLGARCIDRYVWGRVHLWIRFSENFQRDFHTDLWLRAILLRMGAYPSMDTYVSIYGHHIQQIVPTYRYVYPSMVYVAVDGYVPINRCNFLNTVPIDGDVATEEYVLSVQWAPGLLKELQECIFSFEEALSTQALGGVRE